MNGLVFNWYNLTVLLFGCVIWVVCNDRYKETKHRPLLTCIPGVFTSLGMLCTFISICVSLNGIQADNDGRFDIVKLINGLVPAFTSSILGLIFALISMICSKFVFAEEEKNINANLGGKTPEDYLSEIAGNVKSIVASNQAIAGSNQQIVASNQQIVTSVKSLLAYIINWNTLFTNCQTLLVAQNNLIASIEKLEKDQLKQSADFSEKLDENIKDQTQVLGDFIDNFLKRMDEIFNHLQDGVSNQVHDFGEEQFTKTSQLLESITEKLSSVSSEIIDKHSLSVESAMKQTNERIDDMNASSTESLANLMTNIQNAVENLCTEQVKQMAELKDMYNASMSNMLEKTIDLSGQTTNSIKGSMDGLSDVMQKTVSQQCEVLSATIASNVEALKKDYEFISGHVAEIKQNYDQAAIAFEDAVRVAHRTNETSEKAIEENNRSLQAVADTNTKISEVLDLLTTRQDNIEQLTRKIGSVSAAIEELQKMESMINKLVNK